MTDPVHQANKSLVLDYWAALDNPDLFERMRAEFSTPQAHGGSR